MIFVMRRKKGQIEKCGALEKAGAFGKFVKRVDTLPAAEPVVVAKPKPMLKPASAKAAISPDARQLPAFVVAPRYYRVTAD